MGVVGVKLEELFVVATLDKFEDLDDEMDDTVSLRRKDGGA